MECPFPYYRTSLIYMSSACAWDLKLLKNSEFLQIFEVILLFHWFLKKDTIFLWLFLYCTYTHAMS